MRINDDRNRIDREAGVQGPRWHTVHEGYFADAAIAQPFVEAVRRAVLASKPHVVADLGGGTGFVLCQLRAAGLGGDALEAFGQRTPERNVHAHVESAADEREAQRQVAAMLLLAVDFMAHRL
ncbi:MAG: hypothetical protein NTX40_08895 [Planctomycetota bacterium]|nr:hypothetical protein [Planctomycetota bacterium]